MDKILQSPLWTRIWSNTITHKNHKALRNQPLSFRPLLDSLSCPPLFINLHIYSLTMACAKTARIEPFTFSVRENSAITVADNPSIVFQPKAIKSISAMSDTTLKRVIKSVNGARTVSDLMKAVEMPWCFQNEDIDTTAKRSVAIDRQTARPQNQVNPGESIWRH